jgi:hypothetical protein
MSRGRSLRRLWRSPYVVAAAALLFASGLVAGGSTLASFTSETENTTATFAGGWVGPAKGLTVTPSGYNAQLTWSPATHGLDGQTLQAVDNGTSSSCPANGYTSLGALGSATASSTTDSSTLVDSPRSGVNGHYVCYQLVSTRSGTNWTATASFPATVLGLVPTSVAYSGSPIQNGTTITITYNQPVSLASATAEVCIVSGGSPLVAIGTTTCTAAIGSFSGGTAANSNTCSTSTAALISTTQVQVTAGGCQNGTGHTATMGGGTTTFTAAGTDVTSATGGIAACTTSLCKPTMSW